MKKRTPSPLLRGGLMMGAAAAAALLMPRLLPAAELLLKNPEIRRLRAAWRQGRVCLEAAEG